MINYLEKPRNRAIVLFPQSIIWLITSMNLYLYHCFQTPLLYFCIPRHLISASFVMISAITISVCDIKRQNYDRI